MPPPHPNQGVIAADLLHLDTAPGKRLCANDLEHRTEAPRFLLRDRDGKYGRTFDPSSGPTTST